MTPGRTRGQLGCWGQEEKQDQAGQEGGCEGGRAGRGSRRSPRRPRDATPGGHRCRSGSSRGAGSRTLTDGQRDEGHLDEERQPAQHVHEPHGAPAPPAPRPPGRACALRFGRQGAAATVAASPPRGRSCAAAESSPAREPPSAGSRLAPPTGAEGQPLLPQRRVPADRRAPPAAPRRRYAMQSGEAGQPVLRGRNAALVPELER